MQVPFIKVKDKQNDRIHVVGSDAHDRLIIRDGSIHYMNLQNGEGTGERGDYEFVVPENEDFLPEIEFHNVGKLVRSRNNKGKRIMKITEEQEQALNEYKASIHPDHWISVFLNQNSESEKELNAPFEDFDLKGFGLLLGGFYEVEQPFQVGDWVIYTDHSLRNHICKVIDVQYCHDRIQFEKPSGWKHIEDVSRHATDEEIAQEKERRKWAAIDRKIGEFKNGDVAKYDDGENMILHGYIQVNANHYTVVDESGVCKTISKLAGPGDFLSLICPVEKRFDIKEDSHA